MHQKYYQCTGTEFRLSECSSYNDTAVRTHYDDVGIYCYSGLGVHKICPRMFLKCCIIIYSFLWRMGAKAGRRKDRIRRKTGGVLQ